MVASVGYILNVLNMDQFGMVLVLCPSPYNVLAMYQVSTSPLAPSEKTTMELKVFNKKGDWMNNVFHEDCRKLRLQEKRVDSLIAFKERATTQLVDMLTWA